jgi:hypothetical protein
MHGRPLVHSTYLSGHLGQLKSSESAVLSSVWQRAAEWMDKAANVIEMS